MEIELLHRETTDQIIKTFYKVYNTLGFGFLEKVYENALSAELISRGFQVENPKRLEVYYEDQLVGEYFADVVVEEKIILELKSAESLHPAHEAQLMNYLKATEIEVGLLLNFGVKPEFKRKLFTNPRKSFRTIIE
jgi:GxxExxY protein